MATTINYALLAGASYYDTRFDINRFPIPQNWAKIINPDSHFSDPATGFEAISFTNGNEIVISFAGTYDKDIFGDMVANAGLATGVGSAQLLQAVEYYLQVKAANPGATITLTGHSLGGGLAALVAVFFGVEAQTFDQAPFAQTAWFGATSLMAYLAGKLDASGNRIYSDAVLAPLTSYIDQKQTFGALNTFIPNAGLVTNINAQGEFLSGLPWNIADRIGTTVNVISNSAPGVSGDDLHAQSLLSAFLQSQQTAATGKALNDVTYKLTDLLKMIFDPKLFAYRTDDASNRNLLDHLIRHEAGGIGDIPTDGDAMVTRFTSDLWKLAQEGGMTLKDGTSGSNWVSRALTAFAMQKYYEEKSTSAGYKKELFTDLATEGSGSSGIHFDMADVSDKFATALANNEKLTLTDAKGFDLYLKYYFDNNLDVGDVNFTAEEDALIKSMLPYLRDWYIQAGLPGMIASDANGFGNGAFMLGGTADDYLTGGTGADLLVGNAGDDVLAGGMGNDVLIGGKGNDTYKYNTGEGFDTILDRDGNGSIVMNGAILAGGDQYGDKRVFRAKDANGVNHLYTYVTGDKTTGGGLIVDGAVLIKDYQPTSGNRMGFTFADAPADVNPQTIDPPIIGDYKPLENYAEISASAAIDPTWVIVSSDQAQTTTDTNGNLVVLTYNVTYNQVDTLGNLIPDTSKPDPTRADTLYDSTGNDSFEFADGSVLSTTELLAWGVDLYGSAGGCAALLWHTKADATNDPNLLAA